MAAEAGNGFVHAHFFFRLLDDPRSSPPQHATFRLVSGALFGMMATAEGGPAAPLPSLNTSEFMAIWNAEVEPQDSTGRPPLQETGAQSDAASGQGAVVVLVAVLGAVAAIVGLLVALSAWRGSSRRVHTSKQVQTEFEGMVANAEEAFLEAYPNLPKAKIACLPR